QVEGSPGRPGLAGDADPARAEVGEGPPDDPLDADVDGARGVGPEPAEVVVLVVRPATLDPPHQAGAGGGGTGRAGHDRGAEIGDADLGQLGVAALVRPGDIEFRARPIDAVVNGPAFTRGP